jgi:tripartite-type tricarboxylate transporter receptor subunit TctC
MALLNVKTGMQALHVPYRGAGPSLTSVLSGETQLSFLVPPIVLPHAASGKLRVIAVSSRERSNVFPNVPTVQEQGVRDYGVLSCLYRFIRSTRRSAKAATADSLRHT